MPEPREPLTEAELNAGSFAASDGTDLLAAAHEDWLGGKLTTEWHDRVGQLLRALAAAKNENARLQASIDGAYGAMRSSEMVGGMTEHDAWVRALDYLGHEANARNALTAEAPE